MKENNLVSNYTVKNFKPTNSKINEVNIENIVNREFKNRNSLEVLVSDLTYVRIKDKWGYICTIEDLFNREIIGYSRGIKKDAELVKSTFLSSKYPLNKMKIFHTDRGKEYDNEVIDDILTAFGIDRSLSRKGNPYDNATSEVLNKTIKVEFVYQNTFDSLDELLMGLAEYVYYYNNIRLHSSLGYMTPVEYRKNMLC